MLQLEDVIEDDTGEVVGGDGGLVDAALDIVYYRRPLGRAPSVPAIKSQGDSYRRNVVAYAYAPRSRPALNVTR